MLRYSTVAVKPSEITAIVKAVQ